MCKWINKLRFISYRIIIFVSSTQKERKTGIELRSISNCPDRFQRLIVQTKVEMESYVTCAWGWQNSDPIKPCQFPSPLIIVIFPVSTRLTVSCQISIIFLTLWMFDIHRIMDVIDSNPPINVMALCPMRFDSSLYKQSNTNFTNRETTPW